MNWKSASEFFAMGGYATYVWGAYVVTAACMTLSSASQVTVGARISKSGNAIPQPGDLAGETTGVTPGAKNVEIRIGSVVGKP